MSVFAISSMDCVNKQNCSNCDFNKDGYCKKNLIIGKYQTEFNWCSMYKSDKESELESPLETKIHLML